MNEQRRHDRIAMVLPTLRVALRRARRRRGHAVKPAPLIVDAHRVDLPLGRRGVVTIDGRDAGPGDVRHDGGSSTLEVWTALVDEADAPLIASALVACAREMGVRRIAWALVPGSPEHRAASAAGLVREGAVTGPLDRPGVPHELWAALLTEL